ncbi:MAG: cyclic nucleotide-binding domain-containing protein [Deltaproteobacteria bacterium]|nr:cyclic nucleotide-binding domain-containing protein [Deltaproteobacteria bacterium]MCW9050039.1 cyclic nucleotide-binding domain-containing protein [Deltaproteobacteria bacterium]
MNKVDFTNLKDSPLFKGVAATEIEFLSSVFSVHQVTEGKTVFVENMPGEALYLIKQGTITISQMLSENNEQILVVLGAGDMFGELAIIDGDARATSARVAEKAILYGLKRKDFMALASEHPRLGMQLTLNIARTVSSRMRSAKKDYRTMLTTLIKRQR